MLVSDQLDINVFNKICIFNVVCLDSNKNFKLLDFSNEIKTVLYSAIEKENFPIFKLLLTNDKLDTSIINISKSKIKYSKLIIQNEKTVLHLAKENHFFSNLLLIRTDTTANE